MSYRTWIFRLNVDGDTGDPEAFCPVDLNKEKIIEYRKRVESIKNNDNSKYIEKDVYCEDAVGRRNILAQMLEMEKDDIIFVPKIPDDSKFSVVKVKRKIV